MIVCSGCGMKYEEGNVPAFCGECGTKLEEVKTTPEEKMEEAKKDEEFAKFGPKSEEEKAALQKEEAHEETPVSPAQPEEKAKKEKTKEKPVKEKKEKPEKKKGKGGIVALIIILVLLLGAGSVVFLQWKGIVEIEFLSGLFGKKAFELSVTDLTVEVGAKDKITINNFADVKADKFSYQVDSSDYAEVTFKSGTFTVKGIEKGKVIITLTAPGFEETTVVVTVKKAKGSGSTGETTSTMSFDDVVINTTDWWTYCFGAETDGVRGFASFAAIDGFPGYIRYTIGECTINQIDASTIPDLVDLGLTGDEVYEIYVMPTKDIRSDGSSDISDYYIYVSVDGKKTHFCDTSLIDLSVCDIDSVEEYIFDEEVLESGYELMAGFYAGLAEETGTIAGNIYSSFGDYANVNMVYSNHTESVYLNYTGHIDSLKVEDFNTGAELTEFITVDEEQYIGTMVAYDKYLFYSVDEYTDDNERVCTLYMKDLDKGTTTVIASDFLVYDLIVSDDMIYAHDGSEIRSYDFKGTVGYLSSLNVEQWVMTSEALVVYDGIDWNFIDKETGDIIRTLDVYELTGFTYHSYSVEGVAAFGDYLVVYAYDEEGSNEAVYAINYQEGEDEFFRISDLFHSSYLGGSARFGGEESVAFITENRTKLVIGSVYNGQFDELSTEDFDDVIDFAEIFFFADEIYFRVFDEEDCSHVIWYDSEGDAFVEIEELFEDYE